jgi:hypothetical protein
MATTSLVYTFGSSMGQGRHDRVALCFPYPSTCCSSTSPPHLPFLTLSLLVFVHSWQSAIAAKPTATYKGYLLGGLCWFAIPFTLATSLGLAGRALDLPITIDESDRGLTPPAVAVHLMGKGGAFLMVSAPTGPLL